VFIVFALVAAVAHGGFIHAPIYGEVGTSQRHRVDDGLGSYTFGYDEAHTSGGSFHKESGSPGVKVGSYGLHGADGKIRVVNYVADGLGFRADIKTNEPGVGAQAPAATAINGVPGAVAAPIFPDPAFPAPVFPAPVLPTPVFPAPVVAGAVTPVIGGYGAFAHHGLGYKGAVHHAGLGYATTLKHDLGYAGTVHHGLGYGAAIYGGLGYGGIHHGLGYAGGIHHGLGYAGGVHHGLGYAGLGHVGLGYHAGIPGHVSKIAHGTGLVGAVKVF